MRFPFSMEGFFPGRLLHGQVNGGPHLNGRDRRWPASLLHHCYYSQLADLMIGALVVSLQVQPVDGVNARRRAQAAPPIIQTFLKGCLDLGREANDKTSPQVVCRSTNSRASRGPFPNFPIGFLSSLTPCLATCSFLGGLPCVLFITLASLGWEEPCPCPNLSLP